MVKPAGKATDTQEPQPKKTALKKTSASRPGKRNEELSNE